MTNVRINVIIFGAGPHGKVIKDILLSNNDTYNILGFIDNKLEINEDVHGYKVLGRQFQIKEIEMKYGSFCGIVGIGDNFLRKKVVGEILNQDPYFTFINAIHLSCIIDSTVSIGVGSVFMPGVIINAEAVVGDHCVINTNSMLEHNCKMGDFSSIAGGVCMGGYVSIGENTSIALGVTILDKISIGENSMIGAASLVTKNIPSNVLAYGHPTKIIREYFNE